MTPLLTGVFASQISGHLYAGPTGAFDSLGTVTVPSGGLSSITFAGIPSSYKNLQIRGIARNTGTSGPGAEQNLRMQFNSDTASNYSHHYITSTGGASPSGGSEFTTSIMIAYGIIPMSSELTNAYGAFITDIIDYNSNSKHKIAKSTAGRDLNTSGYLFMTSGNWRNTNAINTITLYPQGGAFQQYSSFALYGVK